MPEVSPNLFPTPPNPTASDLGDLFGRTIRDTGPNGPTQYVILARHADGSYLKYDYATGLDKKVQLQAIGHLPGDPQWLNIYFGGLAMPGK